jgi:hypothetical protein
MHIIFISTPAYPPRNVSYVWDRRDWRTDLRTKVWSDLSLDMMRRELEKEIEEGRMRLIDGWRTTIPWVRDTVDSAHFFETPAMEGECIRYGKCDVELTLFPSSSVVVRGSQQAGIMLKSLNFTNHHLSILNSQNINIAGRLKLFLTTVIEVSGFSLSLPYTIVLELSGAIQNKVLCAPTGLDSFTCTRQFVVREIHVLPRCYLSQSHVNIKWVCAPTKQNASASISMTSEYHFIESKNPRSDKDPDVAVLTSNPLSISTFTSSLSDSSAGATVVFQGTTKDVFQGMPRFSP